MPSEPQNLRPRDVEPGAYWGPGWSPESSRTSGPDLSVDAITVGHGDLPSFALVSTDTVPEQTALSRLSRDEHRRLAELRESRRRRRWLAGRLLAKHLFLKSEGLKSELRPERRAHGGTVSEGPELVDPQDFEALDSEAYRGYELRAPRSTVRLRPSLAETDGEDLPVDLSISHGGGWTVACLRPLSRPLSGVSSRLGGLDLERVEARPQSFYRGNFTVSERLWARCPATRTQDGRAMRQLVQQRFTLLWTVKESLLKSGLVGLRSVWDFPRLELTPLGELPAEAPSPTSFASWTRVDFRARIRNREHDVRGLTTVGPGAAGRAAASRAAASRDAASRAALEKRFPVT